MQIGAAYVGHPQLRRGRDHHEIIVDEAACVNLVGGPQQVHVDLEPPSARSAGGVLQIQVRLQDRVRQRLVVARDNPVVGRLRRLPGLFEIALRPELLQQRSQILQRVGRGRRAFRRVAPFEIGRPVHAQREADVLAQFVVPVELAMRLKKLLQVAHRVELPRRDLLPQLQPERIVRRRVQIRVVARHVDRRQHREQRLAPVELPLGRLGGPRRAGRKDGGKEKNGRDAHFSWVPENFSVSRLACPLAAAPPRRPHCGSSWRIAANDCWAICRASASAFEPGLSETMIRTIDVSLRRNRSESRIVFSLARYSSAITLLCV